MRDAFRLVRCVVTLAGCVGQMVRRRNLNGPAMHAIAHEVADCAEELFKIADELREHDGGAPCCEVRGVAGPVEGTA